MPTSKPDASYPAASSSTNPLDQSVMHLVASATKNQAEAARDPIRLMMEIAENQKLSKEDRASLIEFAQIRFKNRRKMAYICLFTIIASMLFLFLGAFVDGVFDEKVLDVISKNKELFIWINFFLTSIVGAYFGVSALRPSS